MTYKAVVGSFLIECMNKFYSNPDIYIAYDISHNLFKLGALEKLKKWSNTEALYFYLASDGIDVKDSEVLTVVGNMLKTRNFKVFFLGIDNQFKNYNSLELAQIENLLLRNVPSNTQVIFDSYAPSTDVYADWLQKIYTTFRIDFSAFGGFFDSDLPASNQKKIIQSFQHPNCKVQGIDVSCLVQSQKLIAGKVFLRRKI